jgi:hypothetical protein
LTISQWAAGAAFLRGQGSGERVVSVEGVDKALAKCGPALVEFKAPKVGMARAPGYEGEGLALVKSATTEGAKQALLAIIENVQVRYGWPCGRYSKVMMTRPAPPAADGAPPVPKALGPPPPLPPAAGAFTKPPAPPAGPAPLPPELVQHGVEP